MKHTSRHLPRRGQYELFTFNGVTQCYDDPGSDSVPARPEMFEWLRNQSGVQPMDDTDMVYYLEPRTYLLWRLRWA
jgi:hypothetical protein